MSCDNQGRRSPTRAKWAIGCVALLLVSLAMPPAMSAPNDKKTETAKKAGKTKPSHPGAKSEAAKEGTRIKEGTRQGDPGNQVQAAPATSAPVPSASPSAAPPPDAAPTPKPSEVPAAPQPASEPATPTAAPAPTPAVSDGANQPQPTAEPASPTPAEIIQERSQGVPYNPPPPVAATPGPADAAKPPVTPNAPPPAANEAPPPANATEVKPTPSAGEGVPTPPPPASSESAEPAAPATPVQVPPTPVPPPVQATEPAQAPAEACNRADFRVAIDVGHTETNYGALSAHGKPEYEFNLRLAAELLVRLFDEHFDKSTIVIQTDSDLQRRARDLSSRRPNLMLSLHHDSVQDKYLKTAMLDGKMRTFTEGFRGYSIFVSRENAYLDESEKFARLLGGELMANGLKPTFHHHEQENRPIYDQSGVFFYDGLVVLHSTTAPAVLLESAVITNPEDEEKANDKAYRNRITKSIVSAVIKYCDATAARAQLHTAPPPPAAKPSSSEKQGSRK